MKQIIECVPNFSEGIDQGIIKQITDEIKRIDSVKLLNVDPGKATNRTVVTFAGTPEAVIEAAFQAIKKASELIDMSKHKGEHPRMGATDVCPLVPVSGISMEETVKYAIKLAKRVGEELQIPVYLYEEAQPNKSRSNLSVIREGEYEGFAEKIKQPDWKPDFGPLAFSAKSGATVIGARDFLIAYNINLNTKSVRIANRIAFDVREAGRVKRKGNPISGEIELDERGEPVRIPGTLKHVKAIGWFIEEYDVAQISMNLTNYKQTPVHIAFDEVCKKATGRGVRVTGSELVGLIPLKALLDAGKHYLSLQGRSLGVNEQELIHIAVKSLGLDELGEFKPEERIIEYLLDSKKEKRLVAMKVSEFVDETASESPAPGGGSVAALAGALGAGLGTMVANLSADKRGWEEKTTEFSKWAELGQEIKKKLLFLIDEDTKAFNQIMDAFKLPKNTHEERILRADAIKTASIYAAKIPLETMKVSAEAIKLLQYMVNNGNPNSITDAGVGALCIKTAVHGAYMNVLVNASGFKTDNIAIELKNEAKSILEEVYKECDRLVMSVDTAIDF